MILFNTTFLKHPISNYLPIFKYSYMYINIIVNTPTGMIRESYLASVTANLNQLQPRILNI